MNIVWGILIGLATTTVWYGLYAWCYQGLCEALKIKRIENKWGNVVLFLSAPIISYCAIIFFLLAKFLSFLTEE